MYDWVPEGKTHSNFNSIFPSKKTLILYLNKLIQKYMIWIPSRKKMLLYNWMMVTYSIKISRVIDGIKPQVHGLTETVIKDIVPTWSYEFN